MKKIMALLIVCATATLAAQDPKPVWELGKNHIDPAAIKGKVEIVDGIVKLDGTNSFSLPTDILGSQNDYAIEFEIKRSPDAVINKDNIVVVSNMDPKVNTGMALKYCPHPYNAAELYINGHLTLANSNFLGDNFDKISIVAKDKNLALFRNGLILVVTDTVKTNSLPVTFGEVLKSQIKTYELRNIKIYNTAFFPAGSEHKIDSMMRTYSGDLYMMQRAEIKDHKLPRILVVGDSISGGYREFIAEHFKGRAYVDYWVGSSWFDWTVKGDEFPILKTWSGVLSNGPYDVVSWNSMTLHMWTPDQKDRCKEENYPAQMTRVVEHLKKIAPNTKFIWIRCTPYTTAGEGKTRVINVEKSERLFKFNKMTDEIMAKYGIPEVDLYALCEKNLDKAAKDGIHWYDAAPLMAKEIIAEIEKYLPEKM